MRERRESLREAKRRVSRYLDPAPAPALAPAPTSAKPGSEGDDDEESKEGMFTGREIALDLEDDRNTHLNRELEEQEESNTDEGSGAEEEGLSAVGNRNGIAPGPTREDVQNLCKKSIVAPQIYANSRMDGSASATHTPIVEAGGKGK